MNKTIILISLLLLTAGCSLSALPEECIQEQERCIEEIAAQGTHELCKQLDESQINSCILQVAVELQDIDICEEADSLRDRCINAFAYNQQDHTICSQIDEREEQDSCVSYIAVNSKNLTLCEEAGLRENSCKTTIAREEVLPEVCETIEDKFDQETCWSLVATAGSMPELCEKIEAEDHEEGFRYLRESCYSKLGIQLGNETLCLQASSWVHVDPCLERVAKNKQDPQICDLLLHKSPDECKQEIH